MKTILKAGAYYFGAVFALAFVLGTLRTLFLVPKLGALYAVLIEIPIVLALSWTVCRHTLKRFAVPPAATHRLIMGGVAFSLLMGTELALAMLLFDQNWHQYLAGFQQTHARLGLVAQGLFALMPWIQLIHGDAHHAP